LAEECAQLADDGAQGPLPGGRRFSQPQLLGQLLAGNRAAVLRGEDGEGEPALPANAAPIGEDDRVGLHADLARQVDPQRHAPTFPQRAANRRATAIA
jgi:hypothetical protein